MTSFLFSKSFQRKAILLKGKQLGAEGNNYAAPDCDPSDNDLVFIPTLKKNIDLFFLYTNSNDAFKTMDFIRRFSKYSRKHRT